MESGVPLAGYLALGLFMFTVGVIGVIVRRNPIVIFMCIELMLNSVTNCVFREEKSPSTSSG